MLSGQKLPNKLVDNIILQGKLSGILIYMTIKSRRWGLIVGKKIHTKNLAKYLLAELLFSSEDLTSTKGKKQKHIVLYRKQTQGKRLQDTILISCFGRSWSRNGKKLFR